MVKPLFENLMFAFVVAVAAYAFGAQSRPETFASRWSPALTMPPAIDIQPRPAEPGFNKVYQHDTARI